MSDDATEDHAEIAPEDLQHEVKYVVPAARAASLALLVGRLLPPDPRFPVGVVESLYYDTSDLQLLGEKLASDYLKTKVRLRWYPETTTPPLIELKRRRGSRRHKLRLATDLDVADVSSGPLSRPVLMALPRLLRRSGVAIPETLVPVFVVRYRRRRWIVPGSGARVSLDTDITVPRVHRHLAPGRRTPLPAAVLEVKGATPRLPARLASVAVLGPRRSSFSKYLACWEHLIGGRGPDALPPC